MSELKAFNSERIYWAVEQVERVAGDIDSLHLDDNLFYIKYEANKVIAEKDKEIAELKDKLQAADKQIENLINSASSIMLAQDRVNDNNCAELRHQKYKRCLAMAEICENKLGTVVKPGWWDKWRRRWLELAEKFREASK